MFFAKEMWNTMLQVITSSLSEHLVHMFFISAVL
jgi:hypothetical protein